MPLDFTEFDEQEREAGIGVENEPSDKVETHDEQNQHSSEPTISTGDNPSEQLPEIDAHYDCLKNSYWMKNSRGEWIPSTEGQLRRELRKSGYRNKPNAGEHVSPVDEKISEIHLDRDVRFAGEVAGHKVGLIENEDGRILVTKGPKIIEPVKGDWPTIQELLTSLLGEDQIDYFYGWLSSAYKALITGEFTPGQALVIAGERGNGKSFVQNHIITPVLGGREGIAYRYLSGATQFNADLVGAEHLVIADDVPSTDIRSRKQLGAKIKDIVANENTSYHAKGKDAVRVSPLWRLSITVNDEPENLLMLPPLEDSLEDKITMFKSSKATNLPEQHERKMFRQKIRSELPAFANYLFHEFALPNEIICPRFGVSHYHNPELAAQLQALAPEAKLDEIIVSVLFPSPCSEAFVGKASELEKRLRESSMYSEVGKLLNWHSACGTYLARLANNKETGKRYFRETVRDGHQIWRIEPRAVQAVDEPPNDSSGPVDQVQELLIN